MPDRRGHRGPHPDDAALFAPRQVERLVAATHDLAWLLSRGYARPSSLKLVGDRYALPARQRLAVARATCSDQEQLGRRQRRVELAAAAGRALWLDGYNLLTTVEAAMAGGVVLSCRDGTFRDLASMHGSFRKVAETRPALEQIGQALSALRPAEVLWLLDRPVSNSARLKRQIEELAQSRGWPWRVALVADPDAALIAGAVIENASLDGAPRPRSSVDNARFDEARAATGAATRMSQPPLVATADSAVLDACGAWLDLARHIVETHTAGAWIVDLAEPEGATAVE